jgi:hypothetical protein
MPISMVGRKLADLRKAGITVNITPKEWVEHTGGRMDPVQFVKTLWSPESYASKKIQATLDISPETGCLSLWGRGTVYGAKVDHYERQINRGMNTIDHTYLKLSAGEEGAGAVKEIFKAAIPFYQKSGLSGITIHANLEAGAYAWGRYGFTTSDPQFFKEGLDAGWGAITKANGEHQRALGEYRQPVPPAARKEMDALRSLVDKMQNDPHITQVVTAVKTPHLDAYLGHLYHGLTPETPSHIQRTFIKTALYKQHWYGGLDFKDQNAMAMMQDYLYPKTDPKKS